MADEFYTPSQIETQRAIAKALLDESFKTPEGHSGHFTAVSPLAPFAQMAQALVGGLQNRRATGMERAIETSKPTPPGLPPETTSEAEPDEAAPKEASAGGGDYLETVMKPMIAQRESADSKNPYHALGPTVRSGDRAYGKYQVMGNNIPSWTQEALGRPMTPQEFLADEKAQEAVASHRLGGYLAKTGSPRDAASMWFSGRPLAQAQNLRAHDPSGRPIGISGAQYAGGFPTTMPGAAPGAQPPGPQPILGSQALAFNGDPAQSTIQMPGSPAAMSAALTGGSEGAGGLPAPVAAGGAEAPTQVAGGPAPVGGTPAGMAHSPAGALATVPGLTPGRMQVSRQQFLQASAVLTHKPDDAAARMIVESYYAQPQPQTFQHPFGTITRGANGGEAFQGTVKQMEIKGADGMTAPYFVQFNQDGSYKILGRAPSAAPAPAPPGPRSEAAPPAAGAPTQTAQAGGPAASSAQAFAPGQSAPGAAAAAGATPPVQVAARETGTATDAGPSGPLAKAPPVAGPPAAIPPAPGGTKVAESLIPQDVKDTFDEMGTIAATQKVKTELANKMADQTVKDYGDMIDKGRSAAENSQKYNMLDSVLNNPTYFSGPGSALVQFKNRLLANMGIVDPKTPAAQDLAEKFTQELNLDRMKEKLGHWAGQIRVPEINMINTLFVNCENSVAANKALVFMARRVNQRVIDAANYAQEYAEKHGGIPDVKLQAAVFNHFKDIKLMSDDELKTFHDMMTVEAKKPETPAPTRDRPAGTAPAAPVVRSRPEGVTDEHIKRELEGRKPPPSIFQVR